MHIFHYSNPQHKQQLLALREALPQALPSEAAVKAIVEEVKKDGEAAVLRFNEKFDKAKLDTLPLSKKAWEALAAKTPPALAQTLQKAADNIRQFHTPQKIHNYRVGNCEQRVLPLDCVGLYVPGGRVPYPSTVLMVAIPASIAGVQRLCIATPPRPDGTIAPAIALAAKLAGATDIFRMGGAQAVAAFAFGAGPVPRVAKIAGPGNAWVAAAKRLVSPFVGVDMDAGPSEVLIVADASANVELLALDMLAQAEHDPLATAICVTPHAALAETLPKAVEAHLAKYPNPVAQQCLKQRGFVVVTQNLDEAFAFANAFAPEHLELALHEAPNHLHRIQSAGAVFVGHLSPAAAGDYVAGPNHTLPTSGCARFQSALSVQDFQKRLNFIHWDETALRTLGPEASRFARAEGLIAHAQAVEARMEGLETEGPSPTAAEEGAAVACFIRDEIRQISLYRLEGATTAPVKLNQNESPDDIPQGLKNSLCQTFASLAWNRYPPYDAKALREAVAHYAGWKADGVMLANGSNELLALLIQSVVRPGDKVVLPTPCFALYAPHLEAAGAAICRIPALPNAFFDEAALLKAAQGARMVLFTSPNNPTGAVVSKATLLGLLSSGALIVADEAYVEFADNNFAPCLGENVPLVLLRTFSKTWAAAGLRFGYLLGPEAFCREMQKLALPYNVSSLTLAAAAVLLEQPKLVEERVALVKRERARVSKALAELGICFVPSQANFLLIQLKNAKEAMQHFLSHGVLLRNMSSSWPNALRVAIGNEADNEAFLTAMRAYAKQPGRL
ncbi:MAG: histidinol dehydrogenase [Cystobacterineae bacterium]|nr:histidinol dehydrogenase [Cystobacterineae bacterium]